MNKDYNKSYEKKLIEKTTLKYPVTNILFPILKVFNDLNAKDEDINKVNALIREIWSIWKGRCITFEEEVGLKDENNEKSQ